MTARHSNARCVDKVTLEEDADASEQKNPSYSAEKSIRTKFTAVHTGGVRRTKQSVELF